MSHPLIRFILTLGSHYELLANYLGVPLTITASKMSIYREMVLFQSCFAKVITWAWGLIRINFTSIFKVFLVKFGKTLEIEVKLILYCTKELVITCL